MILFFISLPNLVGSRLNFFLVFHCSLMRVSGFYLIGFLGVKSFVFFSLSYRFLVDGLEVLYLSSKFSVCFSFGFFS